MDNIIALLTDFGAKGEHYVASMKGVLLKINPSVRIIDISHNISAFSILEASFLIKSSYKYFPEKTVFIMVIDPGVGTSREILAIRTKSQHYFIGPNNGIFSLITKEKNILECVEIKNSDYFNPIVSKTFHGRDIMAPVAAHITLGVKIKEIGPYFELEKILKYPVIYGVDQNNKKIECTIQYIDSFGNITTNIPIRSNFIKGTSLPIVYGDSINFQWEDQNYEAKLTTHFGTEPKNQFLFIIGSSGFLEISRNQDNAAKYLGLKVGDIITITL